MTSLPNLQRELIEVGYFLSRFGLQDPPALLEASSWKESYLKFYNSFGLGKTEIEFCNSLKNIRDQYDARFDNARVGWLEEDGRPGKISNTKQDVFHELSLSSEREIWERIRPYAAITYNSKIAQKNIEKIRKTSAKFFNSEFAGPRVATATIAKEIFVTHGAIIDDLYRFIQRRSPECIFYNTSKIDLAVEKNSKLIEIYELKTSSDTQSIYTAVGQLFMHSAGADNVEKWMVLPAPIENSQLLANLRELNVNLLQYTLSPNGFLFE